METWLVATLVGLSAAPLQETRGIGLALLSALVLASLADLAARWTFPR